MFFNWFSKKKNNKGLIGVDIQAEHLAIAHILYPQKEGEKPTLKQCVYKEISTVDEKEFIPTLSKMAKTFPVKQFSCNSILDKGQYELLLITPPKVESNELRQAVKWRIKDQLAYHVDDAVIDIFEIPVQQSASSKFMYAVAAQKRDIDVRAEYLKKSALDIASIDIYELSQRNIARLFAEDKDGIVLLKFNDNGGLLTITRNGVLYLARNIDFGIQRLKQALNESSMQETSADEEIELFLDDEILDENTEISVAPAPVLNEQAKLILDEVILEIQRSLDYYVSHFNQRQVRKIVLGPLAQKIPGASNYVKDMLGIETEVLDFNQHLNISKPLSRELQAHCFEAIGLALRLNTIEEQ
ncbi:MAG: pilus assembly protein PilM [gamma proteobacterium symbiont of Taylorina sp.]|nr:pilus assembly protein PilM [gamma proteobacterium symbiont of Taylorina sp.]